MIPERIILFPVQHFQKRGGRVSLVIAAQLVDLVQKHQRILDARLLNCRHHTSRHGSHIRFAVPPDLRLIAHAPEAYPHIFFLKRLRHALRHGGLARTGRPHETDNLASRLPRQHSDGKKFQHPLLHL